MFIKLSKLDEELMYFYLLGGVESTTILEENEKKNCAPLCKNCLGCNSTL